MPYKNNILLDTLAGKKTNRYPVWVMRQAGRVLKEYREVRALAGSFINLVTTPELAAEVTIQPVDLLGVDAAIIFSDILVVPEAMGFPYKMEEEKGPVFSKTIAGASDIHLLENADVEDRLAYVLEAIKLTKKGLENRVPLIGFAGAPLTIFAYLTEGKGSKTFSATRKFLYVNPAEAHMALQKITDTTIAYLKAQVRAGADIVQLFDSWAGIFEPEQYKTFGEIYINQITKAITEVPVTVFAKGAWWSIERFAQTGCTTIGIDWNITMADARQKAGNTKVLQGNLDPCVLYGTIPDIQQASNKMLQGFAGNRHIANLGHGVYPDTDPQKLRCFIDTVKEFNLN
ncbi:MAG TPA: uroporphyrinogen decarboxylase [Flavobacteriales bacterium]|nr:uroporphyrinogen decarboxylase [Flavobacteriales bacterium]